MVLLGVRMALKNDLHCSAAELVYSNALQLPAKFFHSSGSNPIDQVNYVTRLKETMMQLQATPTRHHMRQRPFMSSDLSHCTHLSHCIHVFVRQNAVHETLQQPYHGPHKVVECGAKTFNVDVNSKQEVISPDRLKSAHIKDFGYNICHRYWRYSLASFTSCTNSTAHNEDNSVRTTCPLA